METDERYADWLAGFQALLDASDETQEAFGKKVGKSREHINSILNNRKRAGEDLQDAISRALGMSYDDVRLYGREKLGKPLRVTARQTLHLLYRGDAPAQDANLEPAPMPDGVAPARYVTVLRRVSAGDPRGFGDEDVVGEIAVGGDIPAGAYAWQVSGDSMLRPDGRGIRDGDVVFFVEETNPAHNDVVLVNDEFGDAVLKRLKLRPDGGYALVSDNPNYKSVTPNEAFRIVGKVVDVIRKPDWR